MIQPYQQQFLEFAINAGVLRFGEFRLKSGRISPYFFNSGLFNKASHIAALGRYYAQAIMAHKLSFDCLFGPAYKGIPLATATAIALTEQHQFDCGYAFNRKETKDHGEGGNIVGMPLSNDILIIDDVISAGTSINESVQIIQQYKANPVAVIISLDREERGQGACSASQEIYKQHHIPVYSIVNIHNVLDYLTEQKNNSQALAAIKAYLEQYKPTAL